MPLRAVAGLIVACIAAETSAFVSLPTRTAGIVGGNAKRLDGQSVSLHMMGKRRGGSKKRRRVVDEEVKTGGTKGVGGDSEEDDDDATVPRLVVMDLDYTLW